MFLDIKLESSNWKYIVSGDVAVENNIWGYQAATFNDWQQCIGVISELGNTSARWVWDWKDEPASGVKAYPEIIYGKKPGKPSTNFILPAKVQSIQRLILDVDYETIATGKYQTLINVWVTDSGYANDWTSPPILREIMIVIEKSNHNLSKWKTCVIGNQIWNTHIENPINSWQRISFEMSESLTGIQQFNLKEFLDYLKSIRELNNNDYISSIEFGTEIYSGQGETRVKKFKVTVE